MTLYFFCRATFQFLEASSGLLDRLTTSINVGGMRSDIAHGRLPARPMHAARRPTEYQPVDFMEIDKINENQRKAMEIYENLMEIGQNPLLHRLPWQRVVELVGHVASNGQSAGADAQAQCFSMWVGF